MVQQILSNSGLDTSQEVSFKERSELMAEIICKMQNDLPIAQPKSKSRILLRSRLVLVLTEMV